MLNPLSNAFGLDIGDKSFKLAQMKKVHGSNQYRLTALGSIDVPDGIMDMGRIVDPQKTAALVGELMKSCIGRPKGRGVVACLPEAKTFIKIIDAPSVRTKEEMERAVLKEIEQNIPLSKDEIYYDWQPIVPEQASTQETALEEPGDLELAEGAGEELKAESGELKAESGEQKILLGAAPKQLVDDYSVMLEMAGLAPIAFEIEATAISRCVVPKNDGLTEAVGILDIGATRSSLIIYDRGMIQMSISIPVAGTSITKTISDSLKVSLNDAEVLKIECGLDTTRCEDRIWKILLPLIDDLTQKIRNALRFYKIGFPYGRNIEHLYVCGGGAHFRQIDTVLSRKLTIKVDRADAMVNLRQPIPRRFMKESHLVFTTAIGLAMRAADETSRNLSNLR